MKKDCKKFEDYYIGLDIGTSSVGWAVTDLNYNILKFNQKAMWGIRLFDEGSTAAERRVQRSARRRLERRNQRIEWLQEIFAEAIAKKDPGFFGRLEESKYHAEDRSIKQKNTLFNDPDFDDKDYHKKYPTIFHLKYDLMNSDEVFDVRLVYLAIANTLKHRGHFIYEEQNIEEAKSFEVAYNTFVHSVNDFFNYGESVDEETDTTIGLFGADRPKGLQSLLTNKEKRKQEKKKEILSLFGLTKTHRDFTILKTFLEALVGGDVNTKNLVSSLEDEEKESIKFSFSDGSFDANIDKIESLIPEQMMILRAAKGLHDWAVLEEILAGKESISAAKIEKYKEHQEDLENLKKLVKRDFDKKTYDEIFKYDYVEGNYHAYIFGKGRKSSKKDDKTDKFKKASQEEFCKYLGKKLSAKKEDPQYADIFKKIENDSFLPKQREKSNAVIPYQIHKMELEKIIHKAEKYLAFLSEKDESGLTNSEKILEIMSFRIPYYVGPLNDAHKDDPNSNTWVIRKARGKVYPWNFDQKVDVEESAQAFIRQMTNKCTYLIGKDVLPKDSLLYSEFMMLNELNNLRIDGEKPSITVKKKIISGLFLRNQKITQKKLRDFLWREGLSLSRDVEIAGIEGDFKSNLSSYIHFKRILGKDIFSDKDKKMIDDIIADSLYFGEAKKLLKKRVSDRYDFLSEYQIQEICKLSFSGWGRLSREFLSEVEDVNKETGENCSIIEMMRETNYNLMELLSASFGFKESIEKKNQESMGIVDKLSYESLQDLYVSPKVKRSIWQSLQIVEEIRKITKKDPVKIFVEVEREEQKDKKRTLSRKEQLKALYENIKKDDTLFWESKNQLSGQLERHSDAQLRQEKLYLYYTQMGRCMYSGEVIELDELLNNNSSVYDVDHIFPRCRVKDDSLDNKVLVKSALNKKKGDHYPLREALGEQVVKKNFPYWKMLIDKELISRKKFERLTRNTGFSDNELADFINRQLVEARQSSKAVIQILGQLLPKTEIVYSKAGNVSDFRKENQFIKVREMNDFHHAKDAYLNIVVGNVYNTQFTKSPINFIKSKQTYSLNHKALYDREVKRGNTTAWIPGENGTIQTVRKMMDKNNILYTRLSYEVTGELFDGNPMRKGNGQQPLKGDVRMKDINKYGGYNKVSGAYFALVEHTNKKKRVRSIEYVPIAVAKEIKNDDERLNRYFKEQGLENHSILIPKIKIETLFEINGARVHLTGRSNDSLLFKHAIQLILSEDNAIYLKKIEKKIMLRKKYANKIVIYDSDGINLEDNLKLYDEFIRKLDNTRYNLVLKSQQGKLGGARDNFTELELEEQIEVLFTIIQFFQCNSVLPNLTLLGLGSRIGTVLASKNLSNWQSGKIIHQSITGLFEQEVDLFKI
ncbi:MAG: type II CRISPR RNA-guided endonuclease Cas9 [Peptostreptococcaceae bacterium]|nr:type II CRISPR RNA-guided endonuclease Cas9 [Peptostreptococcaceae bacterium]